MISFKTFPELSKLRLANLPQSPLSRGHILGRGFVPVPSSFAVNSLGLRVRELKIQSLGFRVRELKTRTKYALSSHIKVGRFVRNYLRYFLRY